MTVESVCQMAKENSNYIANLSNDDKNVILDVLACALKENFEQIIVANAVDLQNAVARGPQFLDRLSLNKKRIYDIADGLFCLKKLPNPAFEVIDSFKTEDGLDIKKISVPFGVVAIIYEARPNVTIDCIGLCIKSGNSIVLRGSHDAINSNKKLVEICKNALQDKGFNPQFIQLVEDVSRESANILMKQNKFVDVLIPRGSAGLIRSCVENSLIPVIETGTGNCHTYVEKTADFEMAKNILINAKTQRTSVCNACESLLVDESIAKDFLLYIKKHLKDFGVETFADKTACQFLEDSTLATEQDFYTEYLALKISVKVVKDYVEAVECINRYGTKHSDCIVTKDEKAKEYFFQNVDSACVYCNASTRFTDGFMFGFGAEMGISTQKLHARGPMGLKELCSYKYIISGEGQVRK